MAEIEFPKKTLNYIIDEALTQNGLYNLVNVIRTTTKRDSYAYATGTGYGAFHTDRSKAKELTDTSVDLIDVPMYPVYTNETLDNRVEDEETELANRLRQNAPAKLARTITAAILGGTKEVPTSPFDSAFNAASAVNLADPAALQALSLGTKGRANGWLFNADAESNLKTALTAGSSVNPLTFGLNDGFPIDGKPSYYQDLETAKLTDVAGIVGDWSKAILVISDNVNFQRIDGTTDKSLALANSIFYMLEWHVGFAVADKAYFSKFKATA